MKSLLSWKNKLEIRRKKKVPTMRFREYNSSTVHIDSILQEQVGVPPIQKSLSPATALGSTAPDEASKSQTVKQISPSAPPSARIFQEYHLNYAPTSFDTKRSNDGGKAGSERETLIWSRGGNESKSSKSPAGTPSSPSSTPRKASFGSRAQQVCKDLFLPVGYPHTVAEGYLEYQFYDSLQGLCSYLRGVVSTSAVLTAAGVGDAQATAMSAAMTWAIRDGLGMIGGLLFSYVFSPHFDAHVKEFRLLADVLNDIGLTLDMALPLLLAPSTSTSTISRFVSFFKLPFVLQLSRYMPSPYLLLTSLSTLCKVACGISAGATKGNITDHFSICGNRADVNAKESTQETLVSLIGMIVGVGLARWLQGLENESGTQCADGDSSAETCASDDNIAPNSGINVQIVSWTIFLVLTFVHVWANYVGVQRLRLRTLNQERAKVALQSLVEECGRWVLGGGDENSSNWSNEFVEDALEQIPSPDRVSESLWNSICGMYIKGNVHLGIRLKDLVNISSSSTSATKMECAWSQDQWKFICDEFKGEKYMVLIDNETTSHQKRHERGQANMFVMVRLGATSRDELKAFLHAHILKWCVEHEMPNEPGKSGQSMNILVSRSHKILNQFFTPENNRGGRDLYCSLSKNGWDVTRLYLGFSPWRCEWDMDDVPCG